MLDEKSQLFQSVLDEFYAVGVVTLYNDSRVMILNWRRIIVSKPLSKNWLHIMRNDKYDENTN